MTDAPDVATLGEALIAMVGVEALPLDACTVYRRFVAGAESNVAVGLSRLGRRCRWLGRIGDDAGGRAVLRQLRGEGVEVQAVVDPGAPTGLLLRDLRPGAASDVAYHRSGSAGSRLCVADLDGFPWGAGTVLLSGVTPALSDTARQAWLEALARASGSLVVLDPNLRRRLWSEASARSVLFAALAQVDILLPGSDELAVLADGPDDLARARVLLDQFPRLALVAVKRGPQGSVAVTRGDVVEALATPLATVTDPVGAGDAWAAGFLAARLGGAGLRDCLELANRNGAAACTALGDTDGGLRADQIRSTYTQDVQR